MSTKKHSFYLVAGLGLFLWTSLIIIGFTLVGHYETTPGQTKESHLFWPAKSHLKRQPEKTTLVLFAHPHCACTRASLEELSKILSSRLKEETTNTYVVFYKSDKLGSNLEKTAIWQQAASIPHVTVLADNNGREAEKFQATVSGQTFLYDTEGKLQFNGGITAFRGHIGDNYGEESIITFLNKGYTKTKHTFVFGCSLLNKVKEQKKLKV